MPKPCCHSLDRQALDDGALSALMPELYALQPVREQNDWHTDNVFQQSVRLFRWIDALPSSLSGSMHSGSLAIDRLLSAKATTDRANHQHTLKDVLLFAALIHDIGKKVTLEAAADGTTRCPGHEVAGARLAPAIAARFDFTRSEARLITTLVEAHGKPYTLFKAIARLPALEQHEHMRRFEAAHVGHLLPLLVLACGDLATSQLAEIRPEKHAAVLDFYNGWIRARLGAEGQQG